MTIGIWGDSITFGSCDYEALGWAGRLRRTLPINDDYQLYNLGICGETTGDLLVRFLIEAEAIEPEKIILAIGINDSKLPHNSRENSVSIEAFKSNLEELIKHARKFTDDITFVGLTRVDAVWESVRGSRFTNTEIEKYDNVVKLVAGEQGLLYLSMTDIIDATKDLSDGLHPNTNGYQKMFEFILQKLHLN